MKPVDKRSVIIGMLKVRRLTKSEKQEQIARDIDKYNLNTCCLQEIKTEDGLIGVKKHKLDPLQSVFVTLYNPLWKWICYK